MYYPEIPENGNTRETIDAFYGYNHNYRIADGEFYDMENLTSDNYPLLSPRKVRHILKQEKGVHYNGILYADGVLAYIKDSTLYYGETAVSLGTTLQAEQQMLKFGAYILIFPAGLYYNAVTGEVGTLGAARGYSSTTGTITLTMCNGMFEEINATAGDTAPTSPAEGDYWVNTYLNGLYIYDADTKSWNPVPVCYIKVSYTGGQFDTYLSEGDAIFTNLPALADYAKGSIVQKVGADYFIIIGFMDEVTKSVPVGDSWRIERRVPDLDYVCVSNNRVWGCYYGEKDGEIVNEIYCSKLGDPKNWYCYAGLASDSYAVSIGAGGAWTGCIEYQGYPTFFKENAIYRIYGRYPAEYQLVRTDCRGVQEGSYKSLAICSEYLLYKSVADVCVYDGSTPTSISAALGKGRIFTDAVAGACLNKYYISMKDPDGNAALFIYDMDYNLWYKEDTLPIQQFTGTNFGEMYGYTNTIETEHEKTYTQEGDDPTDEFWDETPEDVWVNPGVTYSESEEAVTSQVARIYGFGATQDGTSDVVTEEYTSWYAETGEMGYEYADHKFVDRISMRAYVPFNGHVSIYISYDDGDYEPVGTLRGADNIRTQTFSINPRRCDHFKLRLEGNGDVRIYNLSRTLDTGSEEP
jgi:hypothetical protein